MNQNAEILHSAVRPIRESGEDWLKRQPFAETLGRAVLGWHHKDSIVLGLYGPWGSGKTSIVNLCVNFLREQPVPPEIIEFNAWSFSSSEALFEQFFSAIESKVVPLSNESGRQEVSQDIRDYAALLKTGSPWLTLVAPLAAAFATGGATVAVAGSVALKAVIDSAQALLEHLSKVADESAPKPQTVEDLRKRVYGHLTNVSRPIFVIIDDIDRLRPNDIRLVFQLIKVAGDFPNIVYLTCFQRDIVEHALSTDGINGGDFLEKIVQVGFNIPLVSAEMLQRYASEQVKLLMNGRLAERWDDERWSKLFGKVRQVFNTPRQIYRFLNGLAFHVSLFQGSTDFEVNAVDLALVEMMRVFEPNVYEALYKAKKVLFDPTLAYRHSGKTRRTVEEQQAILNPIFAHAKTAEGREMCQQLFVALFPFASWTYATSEPFGKSWRDDSDSDDWSRELRICDNLCFDRYFLLSVPHTDISQSDFKSLLKALPDRNSFENTLAELHSKGLLVPTVARLDASRSLIGKENASLYLASLLDTCERTGNFELSNWTVLRYLKHAHEQGHEPDSIILAAARQSTAVAELGYLVRTLSNAESRPEPFVKAQTVKRLKAHFVRLIGKASDDEKLSSHPKIALLFWFWQQWDMSSAAKKAMANVLSSDQGFLFVARSLLGDAVDLSRPEPLIQDWDISVNLPWLKDWFANLTDLPSIRKKTVSLRKSSKLTEEEKVLLAYVGRILVAAEGPPVAKNATTRGQPTLRVGKTGAATPSAKSKPRKAKRRSP